MPRTSSWLLLALLGLASLAQARVASYDNFQNATRSGWSYWSDAPASQDALPEPGNPGNYALVGQVEQRGAFVHTRAGLSVPFWGGALSFRYFIPAGSDIHRLEVNYTLEDGTRLYSSVLAAPGAWQKVELPLSRALPWRLRYFSKAVLTGVEIGFSQGVGELWLDEALLTTDPQALIHQARPQFIWKADEAWQAPAEGSKAWFVKRFPVADVAQVDEAWAQLVAAGEGALSLNGHQLGPLAGPPEGVEYGLKPWLVEGENLLTVQVTAPPAGPAGLAGVVGVSYPQGGLEVYATDSSWDASATGTDALTDAVEVAQIGGWPWPSAYLWPLQAPWPHSKLPGVTLEYVNREAKAALLTLRNPSPAALSGQLEVTLQQLAPDLTVTKTERFAQPYQLVAEGQIGVPLPQLAKLSGAVRVTATLSSAEMTADFSKLLYLFGAAIALPELATEPTGQATGFYHIEQLQGRPQLIDPAGRATFSLGLNAVFLDDVWSAGYKHSVLERYQDVSDWKSFSADRLAWLGFNTLGWGDCNAEAAARGLAFGVTLGTTWLGPQLQNAAGATLPMPDPFDPAWRQAVAKRAGELAAQYRENPNLLGYYLDNELPLDECLVDYLWSPACSARLIQFLSDRYQGDIAALRAAWNFDIASFEALPEHCAALAGPTRRVREDLLAFVQLLAKTYFEVTTAALREADPNHLILSERFPMEAPTFLLDALASVDAVCINRYHLGGFGATTFTEEELGQFRTVVAVTGKPVLVTEWGGYALDTPYANSGALLATEADRAAQYQATLAQLRAEPGIIGAHYFCWVDSTDYENRGWGLVNPDDVFYQPLVETVRRANSSTN